MARRERAIAIARSAALLRGGGAPAEFSRRRPGCGPDPGGAGPAHPRARGDARRQAVPSHHPHRHAHRGGPGAPAVRPPHARRGGRVRARRARRGRPSAHGAHPGHAPRARPVLGHAAPAAPAQGTARPDRAHVLRLGPGPHPPRPHPADRLRRDLVGADQSQAGRCAPARGALRLRGRAQAGPRLAAGSPARRTSPHAHRRHAGPGPLPLPARRAGQAMLLEPLK